MAMGSDVVGQLKIILGFDEKGLKKQSSKVGKEIEGSAKQSSGKFAEAWRSATILSGAYLASFGAVAVKAVSSIIEKYGEFEQLSGGMKKIFDEVDYKKIEKDAQSAYKTMNISVNEYMRNLSGVGATFAQTMGDQKGYDTAKKGMQALADYASGTGKSVELLMDKYQAITRSSSGYLSIADQFAGLLPQTTKGFLEQAQASGYLSKEYTKLSEVPVEEYQASLTQMLEDGVDKMGLLGNTTAESEGTITGSMNAMKSAWENFEIALGGGGDAKEALDNVIDSGLDLANNVLPLVGETLGNIFDTAMEKAPVLTIIGTALGVISAAVIAINTAVKIGTAVQAAFNAVMSANPIFLLVTVIAAVVAALAWFFTQTEVGQQIIQGFGEAVSEIFRNIGEFFKTVIEGIVNLISLKFQIIFTIVSMVFQKIREIVQNVGNFFKSVFEGISNTVKNIFSGIVGFFSGIFERIKGIFISIGTTVGNIVGGAFRGVVNGVLNIAENIINAPIRAINGLIDVINNIPGVSLGKIGEWHLPRMAQGGTVTSATTAMIGEAGREAVLPLDRNTGWASILAEKLMDEMDEGAGREIVVNMTNNIDSKLDAQEIGQIMMTSIRRASA